MEWNQVVVPGLSAAEFTDKLFSPDKQKINNRATLVQSLDSGSAKKRSTKREIPQNSLLGRFVGLNLWGLYTFYLLSGKGP